MKGWTPALLLLFSSPALAAGIVVFGEHDAYAGRERPLDRTKAAFVDAVNEDWARNAPLESSLPLISPPERGKTVSRETHGELRFHRAFRGGFVCRLELHHLLPHHEYILTLNGNPQRVGNALLLSAVPHMAAERYFDFLIVRTDAEGSYSSDFGIKLLPGAYDVRCYVKDTADFKIVLYRDFFRFDVL